MAGRLRAIIIKAVRPINGTAVYILFLPESTEGISAGQTTAMEQDIVDYEKSDTISSNTQENDVKTVQND